MKIVEYVDELVVLRVIDYIFFVAVVYLCVCLFLEELFYADDMKAILKEIERCAEERTVTEAEIEVNPWGKFMDFLSR